MGLSAQDMTEIGGLLEGLGTAAGAFEQLRARFPEMPVTRVDASDIGMDLPVQQYEHFDLYLVDGGSHCWSLTDSPERATGFVVAAHPGKR
jgi:hypothetical protein